MSTPIYVLRKPTDPVPERETCSLGTVVIMHSGDILVWNGSMWDLLPGRYLSPEQLKDFVSYVASGWPPDHNDLVTDLSPLIEDEKFIARAVDTCRKIFENTFSSGE